MKKYSKPTIDIISLRTEEDIAKVPTTFYKKGTGGWTKSQLQAIAEERFNIDNESL